jgi:phage-related protein
VKIIFFMGDNESVPSIDWLDRQRSKKVRDRCSAYLKLLAVYGHELRRPYSDSLHDGIKELRIRIGTQNYRILYFFYGQKAVVISHAIVKESRVPEIEIQRAIRTKQIYDRNPEQHSYTETEQYYEKES